MANTLLTEQAIAKEGLMVLENNLVLGNLVYKDYSREFVAGRGATVQIRQPASLTATAFSTTVAAQNVTESSVAVVLDKHYDVTFNIAPHELELTIVDFSNQFLKPAMRSFAQEVDASLAALGTSIAGHTAVSSTPALGDLANLGAQLSIQKVPFQERRSVLHPATQAKYLGIASVAQADARGLTETMREARIGRIMGMDFYVDQNVTSFNSGIADTAGAFNGAATAGATAATVDALTNDEVVAAGDVFKVAGSDRGYLIVTGGTVATNAVTITFTPALDAAIADNAVVTFQGDHKVNLAFHPQAFALVTRPLMPPLGGARAETLSYKGVTVRVVYGYNQSTKVNQVSLDMLWGVKVLNKELAARLCD